ncbi:GDP-L-fucose synthase [Streptomyces sp. TRM66268-LWL]|uniref:GDP-L-fucose synthase n=1 Tax=Streptomyces polyasparticus TaxID=2767826 RepID=A0ABR7SJC4_9ACTN|nr:GDP-L-fucose synthase [Streptomyces polyasparticus]MBC9714428.1 GDP-L-fucose synthase [Streptomyces polyasparticus]
MELRRTARVHIAGHRGLVGSALVRHFTAQGFTNLLLRSSDVTDLRDRDAVRRLYAAERPQAVVLAAARVGGIAANAARPVDFLSDNLRIQLNVLDAAREFGVQRLLFLGSSCIYPKYAPQPIPESALLTGALEPTNDAYAIAKIAGILHVQAMRRQYGLPYIAAMPTNLYGPNDNLDPRTSHVLPAMLQRTHEAHIRKAAQITHWGTGTPRREFLHVDDLARACLFLLEHYDGDAPVNVGTGEDVELRELAELVAETVGYRGTVAWDASRPDGTPRKLLDTSVINALGWKPEISLREGVRQTYDWLRARA